MNSNPYVETYTNKFLQSKEGHTSNVAWFDFTVLKIFFVLIKTLLMALCEVITMAFKGIKYVASY